MAVTVPSSVGVKSVRDQAGESLAILTDLHKLLNSEPMTDPVS